MKFNAPCCIRVTLQSRREVRFDCAWMPIFLPSLRLFAIDAIAAIAFYCAVVRVLAIVRIDNEPCYKEVLKQYPIPGVN